jgi:HD superfamily phosphohydrolase
MGLSHLVYPGAVHSRFHHTLGALHLMTEAIDILRDKGIAITEEEAIATCISILLHDIGHGPFSHALEYELINISHEFISVQFMKELEKEYGKPVRLAIEIFENRYSKLFLHQLVSSQLDMDRLDYLSRDSFFTGVVEGKIGYKRIIKMLHVKDNELVVEEKGVHSIEKFLMARRIMYWQVYLHKTSVSAESMLIKWIRVLRKEVLSDNEDVKQKVSKRLLYFLERDFTMEMIKNERSEFIRRFAQLDEQDIYFSLKNFLGNENQLLNILSNGILNRKLFKVRVKNQAFTNEELNEVRSKLLNHKNLDINYIDDVILLKSESNTAYSTKKESIKILSKNNEVIPLIKFSENLIDTLLINKYFLCFPKINY